MSRKKTKNNNSDEKPQFTVVVPAAGVGARMQADRPKQYLPLGKSTVLEHTLSRLISHPQIRRIVLVVSPEDAYLQELSISNESWLTIVDGGAERSDSVLNGIKEVRDKWVLVHDAARPCVRHDDISKLLKLAERNGKVGGILARQATDTIKMVNPVLRDRANYIQRSVPRALVWQALTPQFFPTKQLEDALIWCSQEQIPITDEASAIELIGGLSFAVRGSADNIKITNPGDLALAEFFLAQQASETQTPAN